MNWYDNLTDEQITQLKENKIPLGLCDEWMQEAFKAIGRAALKEKIRIRRAFWVLGCWLAYLCIGLHAAVLLIEHEWFRRVAHAVVCGIFIVMAREKIKVGEK